jgi:hypothetical protein
LQIDVKRLPLIGLYAHLSLLQRNEISQILR